MTPLQKRFCEEYVVDLNAKQAAIRAGYKPRHAECVGSKLTKKPDIRSAIQELKLRQQERVEINSDHVIAQLVKIAFADIRQLYNEAGNILEPEKLPDSIAGAVAGIEHTDKGGIKIKLNDRVRALELLGRHFGSFLDRLEVNQSAQVVIYLPDNGRGDAASPAVSLTDQREAC